MRLRLSAFPPVVWLIVGTGVLRLMFAAALGLGVDESYMVASGRVLSLSYFDHPPASWWMSWGAAHLFGSEAPVFVRLPFIALFAVSTWLVYRLGCEVSDRRGGFWAAALLNLSPVFGVTTGTWVLPDGPLDCALLAAAFCLMRALDRGSAGWWAASGLSAGLALFSKYSAMLTMGGAVIYLLSSRRDRHVLATPKPWGAALLAAFLFSPVLAWNASHGWASFAFQGGRAAGAQFRPFAPLVTLGGEALFVLPWIWLGLVAVFLLALRRGPGEWRSWLLCCLAAPPIVVFALVSAWSSQRVLFHWAAPGYLMLFPLLGAEVAHWPAVAVRRTVLGTAVFVVLGVGVVASDVHSDWLHPMLARHDPVVEAVDWTSLHDELFGRDLLPAGTVVGAPDWRDAGKIAYALGSSVTTLCLNVDCRQFGFARPLARFRGTDVLILAPEHGERVPSELAGAFDRIVPLPPVTIRHAGQTLDAVAVFRGERLHWPAAP